jgi:hypothetical protein
MSMNEPDATRRKATTPQTRSARRPANASPVRPRARRASPAAPPRDEQIRLRAYQFYLERDGAAGDSLTDWLRAERELSEERRIGS